MDLFEKLNKAFGSWYESWFGDAVSDVRPKDVLRRIVGAMEDNRKEGLDNLVYVPNKYILEIAFESDEEREYLLAFLDKDELETALRRYMAQNKYHVRGPLDFTIEEVSLPEDEPKSERLRVKCKWDVRPSEPEPPAVPPPASDADALPVDLEQCELEEEYTVAASDVLDAGTVSPPSLVVNQPDGSSQKSLLNKPVTLIGRSRRLGNDIVLDRDGMVSKKHAKISLSSAGFIIVDMNSTNGVWVNDERVDEPEGRVLRNGDVVRLGATELIFEETGPRTAVRAALDNGEPHARLIMDRSDDFLLASEVTVGRSLGSDLRLDDPSVSRRHARIRSERQGEFHIEDLGSEYGTSVNGQDVPPGSSVRLSHGDVIRVGEVSLRFELD